MERQQSSFFIEESELGEITELRKASVLTPNTKVLIYSDLDKEEEQIDLVFQKAIKKGDILKSISNFTDLPFRPGYISELWSGFDGGANILTNPVAGLVQMLQKDNLIMSRYGARLAEIIESEDDSKFLTSIVRGFKSHSESWQSITMGTDFVLNISKMLNGQHSSVRGYEEELTQFLQNFPTLPKVEKEKKLVAKHDEEINFENFSQKGSQKRSEFSTRVLKSLVGNNKDFTEFQRKLIDGFFGIRYNYNPSDSEPIYFVGEQENVDVVLQKQNELSISSDKLKANVDVDEEGAVRIFPQSDNYIIPRFSFTNLNGARRHNISERVLPESDSLNIPHKKGKVEVVYGTANYQVSPLGGLMLVYDMFRQGTKAPAEIFPLVAIKDANALLEKKFFEKIVKLTE